jgi:RNA polymerase sigma-70 factor (ECF subfamily)
MTTPGPADRDMSRGGSPRVEPGVDRETELRLVARLKSGDAAAFEAIYEAYRPRLFSFLARLSRRRDVAEDLLEETFLRLVATAHRLRDDTQPGAWLFAVARNLHASWCRHRALDESRISDIEPCWPAPSPGETPFEAAARDETERRLERGLACLSMADREVLLLVGVDGLSPAEAASVLELSPEALRKRLQRARGRLASAMRELAGTSRPALQDTGGGYEG